MLKERATVVSRLLFLNDILLTIFSFILAYWVRQVFLSEEFGGLFPLSQYLQLLPIIILEWAFFLHFHKTYKSYRTLSVFRQLWDLFKVIFCSGLFLILFIFAFKYQFVSRLFIGSFLIINFTVLCLERGMIRLFAHYMRKKGLNYRNLLIVGTGERALKIVKKIKENVHWGLRVEGLIDKDSSLVGENKEGIEVIGTLENVAQVLRERVIDEVIFSVPRTWLDEVEEAIHACEELGIQARLAADLFNPVIGRMSLGELEGIPLLTLSTTPQHVGQLFVKRFLDIVISSVGLIILSPILLATAIAIKIDSSGPILFRQKRVGLNGRTFTFYKFRSMVKDAEKMREQIEHLNEMSGPVFKVRDDPRLSRVGRFIRKFSIDELPQLFNVLKGNMSLVGIRPPVPEEVKKYEGWQRRRLSMKPGITCIWQVRGRNKVDFEEWMRMDLSYIDNWSLKLDAKLLLRTIPAVLFTRGAM
jgi:exopolysaccharide biosynthesis polyprenyl glycosylphosphotransferase